MVVPSSWFDVPRFQIESNSPNAKRSTKNEEQRTTNQELKENATERFEDIDAWKLGRELAKAIYEKPKGTRSQETMVCEIRFNALPVQ
ncbi:MAG: hypothetical protein KIT22_00710 [Verrucomicrobiae bacterium]|nr:hypothetical protein [Verrucomicrobiae bacterium]